MQGAAAFSSMAVVCPHPSKYLQLLQALPAFCYLNGKHLQCQRETGTADTQSTSLFIFPQPCLPNCDEFFHTNRNKTARTHKIKIMEVHIVYWISSHANWSTQTNTAPLFQWDCLTWLQVTFFHAQQTHPWPAIIIGVNWCHFNLPIQHLLWYYHKLKKCQLAPGALMSRGGVCVTCVNVGIVDVWGCSGNKKAFIIMCYLAQRKKLWGV